MKASSRSAFTLVEVLVVIAITSLLSGLILSYSSASRDQVALYVEQAKLSQTFAKAKSLTVSTYNQPEVPCGYGVHVNYPGARPLAGEAPNTYTLFSYNPPECGSISVLDPAYRTEIATERLPGNLVFKDADAASLTDILFVPPNPNTWIWLYGSSGTTTLGEVPITTRSGTLSVTVSVSSAGQISF